MISKRKFLNMLPAIAVVPWALGGLKSQQAIVEMAVDKAKEPDQTSIYISGLGSNHIYSPEQVRSLMYAMVQFQGKIIT